MFIIDKCFGFYRKKNQNSSLFTMSRVKMGHILPKQKKAPHNCSLLVCFVNLELDLYLPANWSWYLWSMGLCTVIKTWLLAFLIYPFWCIFCSLPWYLVMPPSRVDFILKRMYDNPLFFQKKYSIFDCLCPSQNLVSKSLFPIFLIFPRSAVSNCLCTCILWLSIHWYLNLKYLINGQT